VVFKVQKWEELLLNMPNRTLLFDINLAGARDVLQHLLEDSDFVVLENGSLDIGSSHIRVYSTYFAFLCSTF
jgi:hypothetical protein